MVRANIEMTLYFLINLNAIGVFTFNLLPQFYIIASDVLPITHVLYVHNRIYGRVEISSQMMTSRAEEIQE